MSTAQHPHHDTLREGAAEVRDKLRQDFSTISRWTRVRRFVSLSPTMMCPDCDGARQVTCGACGGVGKQKVVWNDEEIICEGCKGEKVQNCGNCFGRGRVKNIHRKKFLWLLGIGCLGWLFLLFELWGRDLLPEQSAKYLHGGGGGGTAGTTFSPRSNRPTPNAPTGGAPAALNNASGQAPAMENATGTSPVSGYNLGPRGGRMQPHMNGSGPGGQ